MVLFAVDVDCLAEGCARWPLRGNNKGDLSGGEAGIRLKAQGKVIK